jgi:hypothetical protein
MNKQIQEVLKKSIETLKSCKHLEDTDKVILSLGDYKKLVDAFKEALEQPAQEPVLITRIACPESNAKQPAQEPMGHFVHSGGIWGQMADEYKNEPFAVALYTRPLIPLSDEKIIELCPYIDHDLLDVAFHQGARAAEKAHGIGVEYE